MDISSIENLEKWKKSALQHMQSAQSQTTESDTKQTAVAPAVTETREMTQLKMMIKKNPKLLQLEDDIIEYISDRQKEDLVHKKRLCDIKHQMEYNRIVEEQQSKLNEYKNLFKITH